MGTSWAPGADQLLSDSSSGICFTHTGPQQPAAQPNAAGRRVKRALLLEERLQGHMDKEDQRVKQLTESLLYDFLPAALSAVLPPCEDPLRGLDAARCRAVAVATLALSSLLNAPPGFLEFLLCIPWHELTTLYPRKDCVDKLLAHLQVSVEERRVLVNTRIDAVLVPVMLDFMYRDSHVSSLPPMLQIAASQQQHSDGVQPSMVMTGTAGSQFGNSGSSSHEQSAFMLEAVAALLDGATPLHCAALRGNPAQVDHLLFCGADPTARTASGELPLQLVPVCGNRDPATGARACRCMSWDDQEVWECRSRQARNLILRRCATHFVGGVLAWLQLLLLCLLCLFGIVRSSTALDRPALSQHVFARRRRQAADASARAHALLLRLRTEAAQGRHYLQQARASSSAPGRLKLTCVRLQEQPSAAQSDQNSAWHISTLSDVAALEPAPQQDSLGPLPLHQLQEIIHIGQLQRQQQKDGLQQGLLGALIPEAVDCGLVLEVDSAVLGDDASAGAAAKLAGAASDWSTEPASELAFRCFVRAVHALQGLELQGGCTSQLLVQQDAHAGGVPGMAGKVAIQATLEDSAPGQLQLQATGQDEQVVVMEDEQAEVYCCWAESVLLKYSSCKCPGCAALAVQAIRMAHTHAARLFAQLEPQRTTQPARWRAVGTALSRVVAAHMALLLDTDARAEPCKAAVWRAEQCLIEWDRLVRAGVADAPAVLHMHDADGEDAGLLATASVDSSCAVPGMAAGILTSTGSVELAPAVSSSSGTHGCPEHDTDHSDHGSELTAEPTAELSTLCVTDASNSSTGGERARALRLWVRTADADLTLAEALQGCQLAPNQTLSDALRAAVTYAKPATSTAGSVAGSETSSVNGDACNGDVSSEAWPAGADADTVAKDVGKSEGSWLADACIAAGGTAGRPFLARPVSPGLLLQLEAAQGLALAASAPVRALVAAVAESVAAELAAAGRLRSIVGAKGPPTSPEAVQALSDAIAEASTFPRLRDEAKAARALYHRCVERSEAETQLESIMADVRRATEATAVGCSCSCPSASPAASPGKGAASAGDRGNGGKGCVLESFDAHLWDGHIRLLEGAIEEAKDAKIGVMQARRLLKELQAQAAAAKAAQQLDEAMARRPCGSAALRGVITHAESASQSIASVSGASGLFGELLPGRLVAARKRLEVERAAEALHRAAAQHRGVSDLPKLEAAILSARKLGAEELDSSAYLKASDLRARLTEASRARGALESAVRALQRNGRPEDAATVEAALVNAKAWGELLGSEVAKGQEALGAWRSQAASEAKLAKALESGGSAAQLARAIQEAAAAGVKVVAARRTLKLLQALESAVAAVADGSSAAGGSAAVASASMSLVRTRLAAAEAGGVAAPLLAPARKLLRRLNADEAVAALESALKPRSDWSVHQRIEALKEALVKAEALLGSRGEAAVTDGYASDAGDESPVSGAPRDDGRAVGAAVAQLMSPRSDQQRRDGERGASSASAAAAAATGAGDDGDDEDVLGTVAALAARARQLLEEDQQEHERQERTRAEEERARKEQQELERAERLVAEQERSERERTERERAAAERREAKARTSDKRGVRVVWAEVGGRSRAGAGPREMAAILVRKGAEGAEAEAAAIAAAAVGSQGELSPSQQQERSPREWQQQQREVLAQQQQQVLSQQLAQQYPGCGVDANAAAEALAQVQAAHANLQHQQQQLAAMLQAQFGDAAAAVAANFGDSLLHLPLTASQVSEAVRRSAVQHGRSESLDILGEATAKLDREVLELVNHGGADAARAATAAAHGTHGLLQQSAASAQQQPQWPTSPAVQLSPGAPLPSGARLWRRHSSDGAAPGASPASAGVSVGQVVGHAGDAPMQRTSLWSQARQQSDGLQPGAGPPSSAALLFGGDGNAGGAMQGPNPLARLSSGSTPRFALVDLGGASWGVDSSGGSSSAAAGLSGRSILTNAAAAGSRGGAAVGGVFSSAVSSLRGLWGSGGSSGSVQPQATLPPAVGMPSAIGRSSSGSERSSSMGGANLHGAEMQMPWQPLGGHTLRYSMTGSGMSDGGADAARSALLLQQQQQQQQQQRGYSTMAGDLAATSQGMVRAGQPQMVDWGGLRSGHGNGTAGANILQQQGPKHQGLEGGEPVPLCHFYQQGYCRDGDQCRFSHALPSPHGLPAAGIGSSGQSNVSPGAAALQLPQEQPGTAALGGGHARAGVGGFAFGAPGWDAFSPGIPMRSSSSGSGGMSSSKAPGAAEEVRAFSDGGALGGSVAGAGVGGVGSSRLATASSGSSIMLLLPDDL